MFGWFFKQKNEKQENIAISDVTEKNNTDLETTLCPYCGNDFKRVVKAKSKCKKCGKFAYKRTTIDGKEVVVTEEEKDRLDTEYQEHIASTYEDHSTINRAENISKKYFNAGLYNRSEVAKELTSRFGRAPEDGDITWYILNRESINTLMEGRYGHYRNVRLDMFDVLYAEKNYTQAIDMLMEVIYLDNSNFHLYGNQFANKKADILLTGTLIRVQKRLDLSLEEIESRYLEKCRSVQQQLHIELDPKESLKELIRAIKEYRQ